MIEHFEFLTAKRNSFKPNISPNRGDSIFEFVSEQLYREYINNKTVGIKWKYRDSEVYLFEQEQNIIGCPTPDLRKVVAIYPIKHPVYRAPYNAVIYNADGSIHLQLKPPKLVSELAKKHGVTADTINPVYLYFENVQWAKDSYDEIVCSVTIGFGWEWREGRVLNPETGEFGECLSSGRR